MLRLFLLLAVVMPGAADPRLAFRLPADVPADAQLVFRAYAPRFEVFVDEQRVYTFDEPRSAERLRLHIVALPHDSNGRTLSFQFSAGATPPFIGAEPLIASRADVPRALTRIAIGPLHDNLSDLIVGAILLGVGIASIVVSRMRRSANASALLWFGVFAVFYALRLLVDAYLLVLFGASPRDMVYLGAWITYVIPIPAWTLTRHLLGDGWKSTLRWQVWVFAIFAVVALLSDVIRNEPGTLEPVNNILVIVGGLNILFNVIVAGKRPNRDLRFVLIGALVFMVFALLNNLAALGVLPIDSIEETPGFLIFIATLNYAAVRMFLRGERERVALAGELATAREIQLSILPTSMPQVQGLRFAARYDPASSVAGDLYDFVGVDATHAGVLVADVAGHGVPAALIASMVKVAVSSQTRLANDPAALLRELNATLLRDVRRNFVTATYLWFDMDHRTVTVSNAGHAPPILIRGNEILDLGPHGVLLGRFAIATYGASTVSLEPGDRIAAWTDGITEARDRHGQQFGEERLYALLKRGASAYSVVDAVHAWRARDTTDADDLTIVIVDV